MKKTLLAAVVLVLSALLLTLPDKAEAMPAFARQTGMACNSCHFQHFPNLNAFGRSFKQGGYTMTGGQSMIEGDVLSLPATLNATLVTKVRFQKTQGRANYAGTTSGTNKGELQFPDEGALMLAGKAGEHIGFLLESSLIAANAGNRFTSFKMPFGYEVAHTHLEVIPFTTDAGGASYPAEVLNTGAVRMIRPIEHRKETSAQQFLGTDTPATGVAFVAAHSLVTLNYTAWAPLHGTTVDAGPYLHYGRAIVTPTVAGWDLGFGGQLWAGQAKYGATPTRQPAKAWAVDAQAQGTLINWPLGVYLTYGNAQKSKNVNTLIGQQGNLFNTSTTENKKAWSASAEFGIVPGRLTILGGYMMGKEGSVNGATITDSYQNAVTAGLNFNLTQNVYFQLVSSWYSGGGFSQQNNNANTVMQTPNGDNLTTLLLFAAL